MKATAPDGARLVGQDLACVRGDRFVFADVSFSVDAGGALLLLGPNGSGKTTLLRLIAGLIAPTAGAVLWRGQPIGDDAEAYHAALTFAGHLDAIKPTLSVADNLAFWARLRPSATSITARVNSALAAVGLDSLATFSARLLSAGQRRRLGLARLALAEQGGLWLLDEPTVALDRDSTGRFEAMVARHRAAGGIVVASSHGGFTLDRARQLELGATGAA